MLKDQNVSTVIVDMPTFDELEQNVAAATGKVSAAALSEFEAAVVLASAGDGAQQRHSRLDRSGAFRCLWDGRHS